MSSWEPLCVQTIPYKNEKTAKIAILAYFGLIFETFESQNLGEMLWLSKFGLNRSSNISYE